MATTTTSRSRGSGTRSNGSRRTTRASRPRRTPAVQRITDFDTNDVAHQKLVQYLNEAHGTELAQIRTLQAHIAMTPRGSYRTGLERHLTQTRDHAERVQRRLTELGIGRNPVQVGYGVVQSVVGQALALGKGPFDALRGGSGEEKLLKNAKDECATEALEIATYQALEQLARRVGDDETAQLAAAIRRDEERMLELLRRELGKLTDRVVRSEIEGSSTFDVSTTGAADQAREAQQAAQRTARRARRTGRTTARRAAGSARSAASSTNRSARRTARQARRVPGVARVEGEVKGAVASASDLPIPGYDKLSADEVVKKLPELSQVDLLKVDAYERKNQNRTTVLQRISGLRGDEPWPGYDEQSVSDIRSALSGAPDGRVSKVREYERRHKERQGVLDATEKELAGSSS